MCGLCHVGEASWFLLIRYREHYHSAANSMGSSYTNTMGQDTKLEIKRSGCPGSNYANSSRNIRRSASLRVMNISLTHGWRWHSLDAGDLVFKLNPGPHNRSVPTIVSSGHEYLARPRITSTQEQSVIRNATNFVNIKFSPQVSINSHFLNICLINTRSIRNTTADFDEYVCNKKFDLVAVTETWLKEIDDLIRAQLCPTGYKFLHKPREDYRGGGTVLLYRDTLNVSWLIAASWNHWNTRNGQSNHPSPTLGASITLYRPPFSEDHRYPWVCSLRNFLTMSSW